MGFWEFMTVLVVFSTIFGYLRHRHTTPGRERLEALEERVRLIEAARSGDDLEARLDVIEEIVIGDDLDLRKKIDRLEGR